MRNQKLLRESLHELLTFVKTGQLVLTIGGVYPLEQARSVHELLQGRKTTGKLILVP